jgi:7,8-dihydropterin-6-yl-methyl-4-(beta-D-ribofuranosyl)aminobenzene 5'-phosphate synthase
MASLDARSSRRCKADYLGARLVRNSTLIPLTQDATGTVSRSSLCSASGRPERRRLLSRARISHAGIEAILEAASAVDPRTEIVFGGLHLVTTPVEEIDALVENVKTKWKVQRIAPGHCTGEPAFARFKKAYGENYLYAGLGTKAELPAPAK